MDKFDISDIAPETIQRVRLAIKNGYPKAVSENYIRQFVTIRPDTIKRILVWLVMLNNVDKVETTSGVFWKWRDNNGK